MKIFKKYYEKNIKYTDNNPLDGTHLVVVRGLIHQEVPTRVRQRGELNWASQLKPSGQHIFSTCVKTWVNTD